MERRAEKRKIEATSTTPSAAAATRPSTTPGKVRLLDKVCHLIMFFLQESDKKSVQFKLKGIFSEATGYRDIKSVLEQEHGLDVKFVSMAGGEARVRLVGGSDSASEVGMKSSLFAYFSIISLGGIQACQGPGDGEQGGADPRHPHQGGGGRPHQAQDEQQQGQERKGSRLVRLLILYHCTMAN